MQTDVRLDKLTIIASSGNVRCTSPSMRSSRLLLNATAYALQEFLQHSISAGSVVSEVDLTFRWAAQRRVGSVAASTWRPTAVVRGFQITVNDALIVRRGKAGTELRRDR